MKTFIVLFFTSIVLSGCIVSPLYGPDGRDHAGHERRDHDEHYSNGHDDQDYHHGDPYRN